MGMLFVEIVLLGVTYINVVDARTFTPIPGDIDINGPAILAIAFFAPAFVGAVALAMAIVGEDLEEVF